MLLYGKIRAERFEWPLGSNGQVPVLARLLPDYSNLVQDLPNVRSRLCQFFGLVSLRTVLHFTLKGQDAILGIEPHVFFVQALGRQRGLAVLFDRAIQVRSNVLGFRFRPDRLNADCIGDGSVAGCCRSVVGDRNG